MTPTSWQRFESGAVAVAILAGAVAVDAWPWLFAFFLVFDLSMIGYLRGARLGARTYNAVHNYVGALALAWAYLALGWRWLAIVALAWGFHVAVDRALGYGLKFNDDFQHTHLGIIGRGRSAPRP